MSEPDRSIARRLAQESLAQGDALGWFDRLYLQAGDDFSQIPWADLCPHPYLTTWLAAGQPGQGSALVVGCGLGDDAEALAQAGYRVTAFDVSESAIAACRRRFPQSNVDYRVADVLALPVAWKGRFDLVVEIYTLQVLPDELRGVAIEQIAACVGVPGVLLVIARLRLDDEDRGAMPWPLTEAELGRIETHGLHRRRLEAFLDGAQPPVRRVCGEWARNSAG